MIPIIAFPAIGPILLGIKSFGASAGAFILGSRVAQIAIVIVLAATLYQCKVGGLESDLEDALQAKDVAESNLTECQEASRTQIATIARLEASESDNTERYQAEVRRSERLADRIKSLEAQQQGNEQDEIQDAIEEGSTSDCSLEPMPDGLRVRVRP